VNPTDDDDFGRRDPDALGQAAQFRVLLRALRLMCGEAGRREFEHLAVLEGGSTPCARLDELQPIGEVRLDLLGEGTPVPSTDGFRCPG
jgi:hypothetical protein